MFTMSVDKNKVDQNRSEDIDPSSNENSDGQLSVRKAKTDQILTRS